MLESDNSYTQHKNVYAALKEIVAGIADVDRCDCVVRDGFFTGVGCTCDVNRLIAFYTLTKHDRFWLFAPNGRAAQDLRRMLVDRFQNRKVTICHQRVLFFERALREGISAIIKQGETQGTEQGAKDAKDLRENLVNLPKAARLAGAVPEHYLRRLFDKIEPIASQNSGVHQDDASDPQAPARRFERAKELRDKLIEYENLIRKAIARFSLYADDSWIDMEIRRLHKSYAEMDKEDRPQVYDILRALLGDYKRYRPLWKSDFEYSKLLADAYGVEAGDGLERMLKRLGFLSRSKEALRRVIENLEAKLKHECPAPEDQSSSDRLLFVVEAPALRLSLGFAVKGEREDDSGSNPPISHAERREFHITTYYNRYLLPSAWKYNLEMESWRAPVVMIYVHRDWDLDAKAAMDYLVEIIEKEMDEVEPSVE